MSDMLSPEEIEALLTSLSSEEATSSQATSESEDLSSRLGSGASKESYKRRVSDGYEVYDFRRPDKLSKDQLRTLHMIHDTFARLLSGSLTAFLRVPVNIELISLEQVPYEEYLKSINQSVFTIFSMPPLIGQAVLEVEFPVIYSMVDRMLGGQGRAITRTTLTEIEKPLVSQLLERALTNLKSAWEVVVIINPRIEGMETSSQFVQVAPPTDIAIMLLYSIKIGEQRGAMSLCIPYLVLKPITQKLAAQKWVTTSGRKKNPMSRQNIANNLSFASINCSAELGRAKLKISEFLGLKNNDVVVLDKNKHNEATLYIEGKPKFLGKPVKVGKQLGFEVTRKYVE